MVGEALKPVRDQVVIDTKFGFSIDPVNGGNRRAASDRCEPLTEDLRHQLRGLRRL